MLRSNKLIFLLWILFSINTLSAFILFDKTYLTDLQSADYQNFTDYAAIVNAAENFLTMQPPSVADKKEVAPGLDKHDYFSLARYWWPNPNTSNGLPYVRYDGKTNPETKGDKYDLARLDTMINASTTLSLAYFLTKDEKYAEKAIEFMRTWFIKIPTRMNPHMKFAQGIPGKNLGRAEGIIETCEFPILFESFELLESSPAWTKADSKQLKMWATKYVNWLEKSNQGRSELQSNNNHSTWYDIQLLYFFIYTDQIDKAVKQINAYTIPRVKRHIRPDGSQPEELKRTRSLHYCIYNLKGHFYNGVMAEKVGINFWDHPEVEMYLKAALDQLIPYANDNIPWIKEDIEPCERNKLSEILPLAARVFQKQLYLDVYHQLQCISTIHPIVR